MMVKKLEEQVSAWQSISVYRHRFGGREFRFGSAEVGHVHDSGAVDIPFPRAFHDELLARGLAKEHRWVVNSGWVSFHVRNDEDIRQAVWLMRLSYLRFALKAASEPRKLLEQESESLHLDCRLRDLLGRFVPSRPKATLFDKS